MEAILGISAYYHDSAACLIIDGTIVAAAQEERFTRIKHDFSFPENSIRFILDDAGIQLSDLTAIAFYEKPLLKFERLLETYHAFAPKGIVSFLSAMPIWIKEKVFMKKVLKDELSKIGIFNCPLRFPEHHLSHSSSAFYPSPYESAAILTIDGVGEWATSSISHGINNSIEILKEQHFPHSLGLLYSAFTYYCGFKVNSGEYKLMGLAPYGDSESEQTKGFKKKILKNIVSIQDDGSVFLNMKYFEFATGLKMVNLKLWEYLFGIGPRKPEAELTQDYCNLALAIQEITEEIIFKMAKHAKEITNSKNLVLAGGVALNCVANGKLLKSGLFDNIWIQPAAGDAGGALGAALAAWYIGLSKPRVIKNIDRMSGAFLGPEYSEKAIQKTIARYNAKAEYHGNFGVLSEKTARLISEGNVVGWFQGRMEYGPRALGNRSILGDARNPEMQKKLNLKIKYREGFRPFAPAVTAESASSYFELKIQSPYMLLVAEVKNSHKNSLNGNLFKRLYQSRSDIPAITHIDCSARIQTVSEETNPRFYNLLKSFGRLTGYELLVNTSFNVRGEPVVCTPDDAYRCFMATEMDYLVMGNFLFKKEDQQEIVGLIKGARASD